MNIFKITDTAQYNNNIMMGNCDETRHNAVPEDVTKTSSYPTEF
jgi:hypothetical protein